LKGDSTLFVRVYGACHRDHTIVDNKRYQETKLDISHDKYFGQEIKKTDDFVKIVLLTFFEDIFFTKLCSHEQLAFPARFRFFPIFVQPTVFCTRHQSYIRPGSGAWHSALQPLRAKKG